MWRECVKPPEDVTGRKSEMRGADKHGGESWDGPVRCEHEALEHARMEIREYRLNPEVDDA
jgi:hypothetical protein